MSTTNQSIGKVLIILSGADYFVVKKADTEKHEETGFFLMELAKLLGKLLDAGYEVTFASPGGRYPNIDPLSQSLVAFLGNWIERRRENDLINKMKIQNNLSAPRPFSSFTDEELETFSGIFIPGGHAPITDLGDNADLGRILMHFHNRQKPTACICHGPYALLSTKYAIGSTGFAYKGYKITSWSDTEEKMVELMKGGEIKKVESSLRDAGAIMIEGAAEKFGSITEDREVVSGGNPMAADSLADTFLYMMEKRRTNPE